MNKSKLFLYWKLKARRQRSLLRNIKNHLPELKQQLKKINDHWGGEDGVYRFFHYSLKAYHLQDLIKKSVRLLQKLDPKRPREMNALFQEIFDAGTSHPFKSRYNRNWSRHTRPIVEAFFHTKFFIEMAIKYSKLQKPPKCMPSGWALVLYFYNLR